MNSGRSAWMITRDKDLRTVAQLLTYSDIVNEAEVQKTYKVEDLNRSAYNKSISFDEQEDTNMATQILKVLQDWQRPEKSARFTN